MMMRYYCIKACELRAGCRVKQQVCREMSGADSDNLYGVKIASQNKKQSIKKKQAKYEVGA